MKRYKRTALCAAIAGMALLLFQSPAWAHHAFGALYDATKPVRFQDASVTKVEWINPHSWIYVDVKQADGKIENWAIEAASTNILQQRAITKDTLKLGTRIVVEGYQAKDGSHVINGKGLTLPDRTPLFIGSSGFLAPYDTQYTNTAAAVVVQPPGAWWTNTALVQRLGLTDDQKARIERAFENHRQNIVSSTDLLEKEEAQLAKTLEAESIDRNAVLAQIDRVTQARREMERATAVMTLEMRESLTRAQWIQLQSEGTQLNTLRIGRTGVGGRGAPPTPVSPPSPPASGQRRGGRGQ
jgi:Spy/CpxP family protein refolding chaperone